MPHLRVSRSTLLSALILGAILFSSASVRSACLAVIRLPFTVLKTACRVAVLAPQLPALARENAALRAAAAQQQVEVAQLREALRHTQQGEALLNAHPAIRGIVAPVMGRSLLPTQQTLLLGRGRREGLTLETVVLDADGVIGRIVEVHPDASLVLLVTDAESRIAALVERSRETGLLVGRGDGTLQLAYVDIEADIKEGDRVITAGLGGAYPKGLPLGSVIRVTREESSGTATVVVKPAAHLGLLEDVLCIPPANGEPPSS